MHLFRRLGFLLLVPGGLRKNTILWKCQQPSEVVWAHSHLQNVAEHHAKRRAGTPCQNQEILQRCCKPQHNATRRQEEPWFRDSSGTQKNPIPGPKPKLPPTALKAVDGHPLPLSVQTILPQLPTPLAFNAVTSPLCPLTWGRV